MSLFNFFNGSKNKTATEQPFRLYVREGKPVALQGWFFNEATIASLLSSLSSAGLTWIWESTRTGPPQIVERAEPSPEHRERQIFSPELLTLLQDDLLEKNIHGFRRFVALYGGSKKIELLTSDDDLRSEVERFTSGKDSLISVLVVQLGDVAADVIYFNINDNQTVAVLLTAFGIPPLAAIYHSNYKEMNGEELETVIGYLSCAEHDH
jgi:hypothetical protein